MSDPGTHGCLGILLCCFKPISSSFPGGNCGLQNVDFPHATSDRHGRLGMGTLYELDAAERPYGSEADSAVPPTFHESQR